MIRIYEYPKCGTCRKAKKFMEDGSVNIEYLDITKDIPKEDELKKAIDSYGDIKKAFNTSGMKYRELGLKDKLSDMSIDEAIKILRTDGMLIKRPFLIDKENNKYVFGFKEEIWNEFK